LESIGYEVNAIMSYDNTTATTPTIGQKHNITNPYNGTCGDMPVNLLVPAIPKSPGEVPVENAQYITYGFFQAQVRISIINVRLMEGSPEDHDK
jgi:hypothetical protein